MDSYSFRVGTSTGVVNRTAVTYALTSAALFGLFHACRSSWGQTQDSHLSFNVNKEGLLLVGAAMNYQSLHTHVRVVVSDRMRRKVGLRRFSAVLSMMDLLAPA